MRAALGPFKMLSTEDRKFAESLYLRLTDGNGPVNELICIFLRDFVYETVEIERLRAFNCGMLAVDFRNRIDKEIGDRRAAIAILVKSRGAKKDTTEDPNKDLASSTAPLEAEIELLQAIKPTEEDYAAAFVKGLPNLETVARLIALAQARRAAALREIELAQAALAQRLRQASENIIEGEYRDQTIQPAPPAVAAPAIPLPATDPTKNPVRRRASATRPAASAARAPLSTSQLSLFDSGQDSGVETVASRARASTEPRARPAVDEAKTPLPVPARR